MMTAARANLIAVKRDFSEPRDIDGVSIISSALSMIASKSHRLKHAVWHALRLRGIWYPLDDESKSEIHNLGWGLERPIMRITNLIGAMEQAKIFCLCIGR